MLNKNNRNLTQYGENGLSGIYRGVVEDVMDPLKLARIRVRVPMFHGVKDNDNYLDNSQLPWATPINPSGSGYDHGTCLVPEVGDIVFVMFEDNDRNYPLYLGGCYGTGGPSKTYGSTNDPSTYNGGTWTKPQGLSEVPKEVYNSSGSPTGKVIYKSPKGSTILIEEADGKESLKIIDSLGQSIRLAGSIKNNINKNNGGRRINADAYEGTSQNSSKISNDGYAEISITDAQGQQVQLINSDAGSSIAIRSGKHGSGPSIVLEKDSAIIQSLGNQMYLKEDSAGLVLSDKHIKLNSDGSIIIKGKSTIMIDANGNISVSGTDNLEITATNVSINSEHCSIRGDLINYSN